jgi:hypothetical protein
MGTGVSQDVLKGRHPGVVQIARVFEFGHLSGQPRIISQMFTELAEEMIVALPDDSELTAGLRKLGEAKDCIVRVAVWHTSTA